MLYNYGSINIDHVYRVPHLVRPGETLASHSFRQVLGGKGANQSLALARAGGDVTHWGRLGNADRWALEPLESAGVITSQVELSASASGHAIIQVDDHAENSIILYPGANHGFTDEHLSELFSGVTQGDWLLLQNECNALGKVIEMAHAKGMKIAFNPAPMGAEVLDLPLEHCQVLFLNRGEAAQLVELEESAPVDTLLNALHGRLPATEVVLTLGSEGVCYQLGEQRIQLPAHRVKAVDTTAAGDTFIGYYLASQIDGMNIEDSLRRASTASALCVSREGAAPSIPGSSDVADALAEWPPLDALSN
ncbi:ribokinase [Cobetia marina]|uniref:ribokinase n=1 Tax=Cobetia marina TaxID=28258 RepID=UPI0038572AE8